MLAHKRVLVSQISFPCAHKVTRACAFRQLLHDLITYLHNSNRPLRQTTLTGVLLVEFTFHVLGFVPADVVRLREDVWFQKLNSNQIDAMEQHLAGSYRT